MVSVALRVGDLHEGLEPVPRRGHPTGPDVLVGTHLRLPSLNVDVVEVKDYVAAVLHKFAVGALVERAAPQDHRK